MSRNKPRLSSPVKGALAAAGLAVVGLAVVAAYDVFVAIQTPEIKSGLVEFLIRHQDSRIERLEDLHMKSCNGECE